MVLVALQLGPGKDKHNKTHLVQHNGHRLSQSLLKFNPLHPRSALLNNRPQFKNLLLNPQFVHLNNLLRFKNLSLNLLLNLPPNQLRSPSL
jgi:hypothetical protein